MTAILGISAYYHDSAAALIVDGQIVAAAQEERFSRRKHDASFPRCAIEACLRQAGLSADELDYVAFYEKPLTRFDRLIETYLAYAPAGFRNFCSGMPGWVKDKWNVRATLRRELPHARRARWVFADHHDSHAASAFYPSPFRTAAILTVDGVGEWTTTAHGHGADHRLQLTEQIRFPHSLGLLYAAMTYYCGFQVNSGEYKLMGLAPYGEPRYQQAIYDHLLDLKPDGSFRLNLDYFNYCHGLTMTNRRFDRLFGGPRRLPESNIEQRHADLAASIQAVLEEALLRMARHVHRRSGQENLVLAGGVALNCVANSRLLREGPFKRIWVQPAAGDAGGALGAALLTWHRLLDMPRTPNPQDSQQGSLLGPSYGDADIVAALQTARCDATVYAHEAELLAALARRLADGQVMGWFAGRMEYGPRALGARSILCDPRGADVQSRVNQKIKFRETFRPFAPAILQEHVAAWFDWPDDVPSPYMTFTAEVRAVRRVPISDEPGHGGQHDADLQRRLAVVRSSIPAVTHIDYSARLQTVDAQRHGRFYRLLRAFEQETGCPVLLNTSFNVRGEPMVATPSQALACFQATDLDLLVLENHVVEKARPASAAFSAAYVGQFTPD